MKYFLRKIYFSIFASLLVIITVATTTFAWYSSNQNALISDISINISSSDDESMAGLELSVDGINFKESLEGTDIKRAVLTQRGYDTSNMLDTDVDRIFANLYFTNVTPKAYRDLTKGFQKIEQDGSFTDSDSYLSLDLYISVSNEKFSKGTGVNVYFQNDSMAYADNMTCDTLVEMPEHPVFGTLPRLLTVNAVNASRIGVVLYDTVDKYNPEDTFIYSNSIYSFSSNEPSLKDGVYNFGGINTEYNAMIEYYNLIMAENYGSISLPDSIKNREDELVYGKELIPSSLGCNSTTMVKARFYFWLEGWDSDCFNTILNSKIEYSIKLETNNE